MKDKKCANSDCSKKTSIGGQALIEGIMMRGPKRSAMAVRDPEGEIVLEKWDNKVAKRAKVFKLPVIRGVFNFVDSMVAGYKCLMRSAEIAGLDEEQPKKGKKTDTPEQNREDISPSAEAAEVTSQIMGDKTENKKEKKDDSALMTVIMIIATVLGVVLAVFLFIMLPTFIFGLLAKALPFLQPDNTATASLIKSVFEGLLRIAVLVAYMLLVTLMKDIRRTFQYHGAEHKTIFCYENGLELTVENVRDQRRFHPRCGTSFLILMLCLLGFHVY